MCIHNREIKLTAKNRIRSGKQKELRNNNEKYITDINFNSVC